MTEDDIDLSDQGIFYREKPVLSHKLSLGRS